MKPLEPPGLEEQSVEQLGETLKRQILELAIDSDNPQFKLDAYKATVERGKAGKAAEPPPPIDGMSIFQRRVRHAENGPDGTE